MRTARTIAWAMVLLAAATLTLYSQGAPVTYDRLLKADQEPGNWLMYSGTYNGWRFSRLNQITPQNVKNLKVKWLFQGRHTEKFETTPLVVDGIMYLTRPENAIYALDALTGRQLWMYEHRNPARTFNCCGRNNRGLAILGTTLFMNTLDMHVVAVDAKTGLELWKTKMFDHTAAGGYAATGAPLVVKDKVIVGMAGGERAVRGFLDAYDAKTGAHAWRFHTIPGPDEPNFGTWAGDSWKTGGAATWNTGAYDPETNTVFWGTGNPWPDYFDDNRAGDNLYSASVLALDPDTGKLKWYYQFTPHDVRDWDAQEPNVLVNTTYRGQERKLLLHADRNGFFYVFDRTNGERLLAEKFVRKLTWASGIGADGRPVRIPERDVNCPGHATNWHSTAFSPVTRLYYVQATEKCNLRLSPGSWKTERPRAEPPTRYLRALDIETGKIVWEIQQAGPADGKRDAGVLATAAGIVFYGDASGYFVAVDERDGKTLWRVPLNATIKTSPMTFAVGGQQFIALAVGSTIVCFGL